MIGVASVYQTVLHRVVKLRLLTVAIGLAEEKTEETTRLNYDDVADEVLTAFLAPFADFSYQVTVVNVNPPDMDTSVLGTTGYKNVGISITHAAIGTYSVHTIITEYE